MTVHPVEEQIARMKSATNARTDSQLAAVLGISPGAVGNARKRSTIPRKWYNRLLTACAQISGGVLGGTASVAGIVPFNVAMNAASLTHDLIKSLTPGQIAEWVKTGIIPDSPLPAAPLTDTETPLPAPRIAGARSSLFRRLNSAMEGKVDGRMVAFSDALLQSKGGPERLALFWASGEGMSPEIKDGDTVLIDMECKELVPGRIFAVDINGAVSLLRAHMEKSGIVLRWDASTKPSDAIRPEEQGSQACIIIGQVVAALREWKAF